MPRPPWLTIATLAVTAAVNLVQLAAPDTLDRLERTRAVRHGEPWRVLTSLLVQDGGGFGALINLVGLAVLGVVAEQVVSRPGWLVAYLVPGLTGEIVAVWWQPTGGGNSVAVCGLAAVVAVTAWRGRTGGPRPTGLASVATLLWVVLMLTSAWEAVFVPGVVSAVLVGSLVRRRAGVVLPVAVVAAAVALVSVRNIHGAALTTGLVLSAALPVRTRPSRFWQADSHE